MNEGLFKGIFGTFLIFSHFLVILLIFILYSIDWYNLELVQTSLVVIIPLFATYTTLILAYLFENHPTSTEKVGTARVVISFAIPSIFVMVLCLVLVKQGYRPTLTVENFTMLIGSIETAFGVYIGTIVRRIFG